MIAMTVGIDDRFNGLVRDLLELIGNFRSPGHVQTGVDNDDTLIADDH